MEVDEMQSRSCKFPRIRNGNGRFDSGKIGQKADEQYPEEEEADGEVKRANGNRGTGGVGGLDISTPGGLGRLCGWPSSRIVRVSRASGGKDRHSKVWTSKGLRDRRVRLSVNTAIQFYDLQDRLGYDQPSKAVEWLLKAAASSISELPSINTSFPDTPTQQLSDEKRSSAGTEHGFDSAEVEMEDELQHQQQQQQQQGTFSKSACSSTSETSKGSGLSLSRSESRIKARERARERAAGKEKEESSRAGAVHQQHQTMNPISQNSSFTELLTGGTNNSANVSNTTSPNGSIHQNTGGGGGDGTTNESNFFQKSPRQWSSTPMDYFATGHFGPSSTRATHQSSTSLLGQIQLGNPLHHSLTAVPSPLFTVTADHHHHPELPQFSFVPDHFIPVVTAAGGSNHSNPTGNGSNSQYNLDFTISSSSSSGLAGFNRGTLQRGGHSSRQLKRAKKLRHLTDSDVEFWRTPSSFENSPARFSTGAFSPTAPPSPQPLPLPELQMLLRRDAKCASDTSNSNNVPLPSPRDVHQRVSGAEEKEKEKTDDSNGAVNSDAATSSNAGGRLISQDAERNIEHPQTWSSRKSPPKLISSERTPDNYRMNIPISAPTSPYSSPALSPQRNTGDGLTPRYVTPPSLFQVWSAPEMPSSDSTLGPGFSYQMSEIAAFSLDNSPLPSPKLNLSKSPNRPASPLCNKLSTETSVARRDSNAQANVHPLPLPPGAALPSQPTLIPQLTPKLDIVPIKSQWQKGKLIGRGTFGSVYVASNKETGALCAMKEVEMLPDDPKSAECIRQLEQEIKVLSHLKHPNIVQYYGSEIVGDRFYIYLEYVHPGSLNKFILDHCGAITESVVRNFTRHILCGLAYLHSTKTIHRDIKGANLLVDAYGVVKLADFGMAKHLNGHAANLSLKGSPYWMAPELLQSVMQQDSNVDLALAIDIWSLGCTIIEMLDGKPPWSEYEGAAAMFKVLKETPPIPENLSVEGKDFLRCCFRRNPAERESASMLLEHRFVKNSHPPDVLSCTQSLGGMKLRDDAYSYRERLSYKLDQVPVYSDLQITKGKLTENFMHGSLSQVRLANDVATKR